MATTDDNIDTPDIDSFDFAEELRTVITFAILDLDIAGGHAVAA